MFWNFFVNTFCVDPYKLLAGIVIRRDLRVRFSVHKGYEGYAKNARANSISHLLHFIPHVCQLINDAISFGFMFSFLYGIKLYFMKHVVKGGILAFVVICLYAFITVIVSAL
jgi:hypothetical protein